MGIIFYELLSGSLPFRGDNAVEIALKHMRDPLPSLREENPAIPQSIENIIRKATAKNPKNRYDDARSMHEDLLTALDDDRMDEPVYQYKYPEHETENTKRIKKQEVSKKDEEDNNDDIEENTEKVATKVEDSEDFVEKKSNIIIIILSVVFGLLLLVLVVIFFIVPAFSHEKPVTVPTCEGEKISVCEKKMQALGLEVNTKIKTEASSTIDKNRVIRTDPEEGRSVKPGTVVTIYKSLGEEVYEIEDYTGKNYIEIQTILETKYGLKVTVEKKEPTDNDKEYDEQEIIGQSLAAGSEVKKGDSITLYIPDIIDKFPDMNAEKWSVDDVEAFCAKYDLILEKKYEETTVYAPDKVISQSRAPGSPIYKQTKITVTFAKEPVGDTDKSDSKDDTKTDSKTDNKTN